MAEKRKPDKEDRRWTLLQAAIAVPLTLAARRLAIKAWSLATGEDPPVAGRPVYGEENKDAVRRFVAEVINKQNLDAIDEFVADTYIEHSPLPGMDATREGLRDSLGTLFSAFPDFHSQEEDLVAEADKVVYRGLASGTHQGDFMGSSATGKRAEFTEVHITRLADGKLVEHWGLLDFQAMQQQLGLATPSLQRT
jgi:predicted ester cyclase